MVCRLHILHQTASRRHASPPRRNSVKKGKVEDARYAIDARVGAHRHIITALIVIDVASGAIRGRIAKMNQEQIKFTSDTSFARMGAGNRCKRTVRIEQRWNKLNPSLYKWNYGGNVFNRLKMYLITSSSRARNLQPLPSMCNFTRREFYL